jgi:xanthine dehydrogenase accessory factor
VDENELVLSAALEAVREGHAACLLTLVESSGSTPREVGAKMLVRADGSTAGTVGGGAVEAAAIVDARAAMQSGRSRMVEYSLAGEGGQELGICGGKVRIFIEVLHLKPTLLIAGAGHVAQPLAKVGHLLGFRTIVTDDRVDLLSEERFPTADERLAVSFDRFLEQVHVGRDTFVVIVTRGHVYDTTVLRQILSTPVAYIGMIGSRRKVRQVFDGLIAEGASQARLREVFAPVGLRTGGQTPAEIAVSIMAEIVLVRHDGTGEPLSWRDNPLRTVDAQP